MTSFLMASSLKSTAFVAAFEVLSWYSHCVLCVDEALLAATARRRPRSMCVHKLPAVSPRRNHYSDAAMFSVYSLTFHADCGPRGFWDSKIPRRNNTISCGELSQSHPECMSVTKWSFLARRKPTLIRGSRIERHEKRALTLLQLGCRAWASSFLGSSNETPVAAECGGEKIKSLIDLRTCFAMGS